MVGAISGTQSDLKVSQSKSILHLQRPSVLQRLRWECMIDFRERVQWAEGKRKRNTLLTFQIVHVEAK